MLDGIHHGFKLGFCPSQNLKSAKRNKPSATQHTSVIDAYLENEVSLGRVVAPFDSPSLVSSKLVALVSFQKKANQENGISLWTCLPPGGASVNDEINPDEFTLHYLTIDQIICLVSRLGKGHSWLNLTLSLLTKMFLFTRPTVFCWG